MGAQGQSSIAGRRDAPRRAALLCISLLLAALPCAGAARLEASLGFGGYSAPGRWAPLRISGSGLPRSAYYRVLRLSESGGALGSETFPAIEGIRLECPMWLSGNLRAISVRLLSGKGTSGEEVLAEIKLEAKAKSFPGHIVLACGLSKEARLALASALMPIEPILVIATTIAELPSNALDYDAVSAIAVGDRSLELSPAQRGSILAWISGGGRLCFAETAAEGADGTGRGSGAFLGLKGPLEGIAGSAGGPVPYGLGGIASLPSDRAEVPASWTRALSLAPYESSQRAGAGSTGRGPETEAGPRGISSKARAFIAAAIAAWLAATLLAAAIGRGRFAPIAGVSALCLASVLAGGVALDKAVARGASLRALALVLPGSGSAFLSLRASAYLPPSYLDWSAARAIGSLAVAFSDRESGGFGEWNHSLPKAAFSLRAELSDVLELEGMLGPEEWLDIAAGSTNAFSRESLARGGGEPPEAESAFPLAFLKGGELPSWWVKDPGARWAKSDVPPEWLAGDAQWLIALGKGKGPLSILAGSCRADSLALRAEGGALREIRWAMILPKGAGR